MIISQIKLDDINTLICIHANHLYSLIPFLHFLNLTDSFLWSSKEAMVSMLSRLTSQMFLGLLSSAKYIFTDNRIHTLKGYIHQLKFELELPLPISFEVIFESNDKFS